MNAALFLIFLGRLLRSTTGKLFVIVDCLRAHVTPEVEAWVAAHRERMSKGTGHLGVCPSGLRSATGVLANGMTNSYLLTTPNGFVVSGEKLWCVGRMARRTPQAIR
jgi:hypothetical protein